MNHLERRRCNFVKWKRERPVTLLDQPALWGPIGTDDVGIIAIDDCIDFGGDGVKLIAPGGNDAICPGNPAHLA